MPKGGTTPTRISTDVFGLAAAVATAENRSAAEQVSYWARIGMQFERAATAQHRRIIDVVSGNAQFSELSGDARNVAHALIDADIARRAASQRFGETRRRSGQRTVSLDDDGNLIEIAADGAIRRL
jgi:hypothetical protein